jgi:uncharacterized repeat protein (TIGR02543 family)
MNQARQVTATFEFRHNLQLFIVSEETTFGTGTGTVTIQQPPPVTTCTSFPVQGTKFCFAIPYLQGTVVTLTAVPDTGDNFAGWSGVPGCGANPTCTFTLTYGGPTNVSLTARFVP